MLWEITRAGMFCYGDLQAGWVYGPVIATPSYIGSGLCKTILTVV